MYAYNIQHLLEDPKAYLPPRPLVTPLDSAVVDLFQDFTQYAEADDYVLLTELVELIDWVWTTGGPTGGHRLQPGEEGNGGNAAVGEIPKKKEKRKKYLLPKEARLPRVKVTRTHPLLNRPLLIHRDYVKCTKHPPTHLLICLFIIPSSST